MANNNQEALDYLKDFADYQFDDEFKKNVDTLQNAIDERDELKNELCLHCGKYKNEHLGACNGCKWYEQTR